ncbi:photosynthetic NDH subunit of subcomplex B 2, chloroplastic [Macadamia integrifolia]|uniref:photosynthetic NDH subunit of subcomplex B 2, chloroplastic n=1 Tax=Macadamia integrifolia TaxID=60698 RepID=UPI001C52FA27|nr:photosynthetic NDH subunit of subcomplex B 2, chloroplastic [Macadamia integrifolia]
MASLLPFSLPKPKPNLIRASSSSSLVTETTPATLQTLNQNFGRKGIKFTESGDVPIVELTVRNGSSLSLRISDGLVTSYKPKVFWEDDGFEEVLYTLPGGSNSTKGGIGLVLNEVSQSTSTSKASSSPLCTSEWVVKDVDSDSIDALQVELSCTCGGLEINYIVSLYPLSMATAVVVKNNGRKAVNLTSAILTHFKFKNRGGAGIQGLRGCSYCSHPPLPSSFEILSPAEAMKPEPAGWFSFDSGTQDKLASWAVEDQPFTILSNKISRVYTAPPTERLKRIYNTPPSKYETIDQGKELEFRFIRMGYDDIYISSPGSLSQKYGKDYFICTGPASMLVPVLVNPGEDWRGAQVIEHDNL